MIAYLYFAVFTSVTPPRDLEGALAINEKLNGAEQLFKGQIKNPKGFAVANKTLYTGIQGGDIIKIVGDNFMTVASIIHPCGKLHILHQRPGYRLV